MISLYATYRVAFPSAAAAEDMSRGSKIKYFEDNLRLSLADGRYDWLRDRQDIFGVNDATLEVVRVTKPARRPSKAADEPSFWRIFVVRHTFSLSERIDEVGRMTPAERLKKYLERMLYIPQDLRGDDPDWAIVSVSISPTA